MDELIRPLIVPIRRAGWFKKSVSNLHEVTKPFKLVQTRESLARLNKDATKSSSIKKMISLHGLFKELRTEINELPLTIIIHEWGIPSASEFLQMLSLTELSKGNAIWLVPTKNASEIQALSVRKGIVQLDFNRPMDRRIYHNLVSDLVFFPGQSELEDDLVSSCKRRTRIIVIDQRGRRCQDLQQEASKAKIPVYIWNGNTILNEKHEAALAGYTKIDEALLIQIGESLKEHADYLANNYYRRYNFRIILSEILSTFPNHPTWNENLVRLADQCNWPDWTIQCLPKLYIPLPTDSGDCHNALIWHYIFDCVPEELGVEVLNKICDDKIYEVRFSSEAARFAEKVNEKIDESLRGNRKWSESEFVNQIAFALQSINILLCEHDATGTAEILRVRKRFLSKWSLGRPS